MTNQEQIENINYYQHSGVGHPLACGNDSKHKPLEAVVDYGQVILDCPDCGYTQSKIPNIPTITQIKDMQSKISQMMNSAIESQKVEDIRLTRKISYKVTFEITETLDFDPDDWDGEIETMDEYQEYHIDTMKEYSEEIFELLGDCDYEISNLKKLSNN